NLGLYDGDRFDARPVAGRERHRQLREGRAAAARAYRIDGLRSGEGAALHRPVGDADGPPPRAGDRPGGWQVPAALIAGRVGEGAIVARRVGEEAIIDGRGGEDAMIATPTRSPGPWLVAIAVVIPTFMEVLDTTIANVALRYIAGGLSAPETDSEWV